MKFKVLGALILFSSSVVTAATIPFEIPKEQSNFSCSKIDIKIEALRLASLGLFTGASNREIRNRVDFFEEELKFICSKR